MPKKEKDRSPMPMAGAGLMRFFEDETHGIKIQPKYVVVSAIALMSVVIVAHVLTGV